MSNKIFRGVLTSRARLIAVLGISALLLSACSSGSTDENAASTEEATTFTPVLKGGVAGALLPEELKLWK